VQPTIVVTLYIFGKGKGFKPNRNINDYFIFVRNINKRLQACHQGKDAEVGNLRSDLPDSRVVMPYSATKNFRAVLGKEIK
jgi:hypothetical protein